MAINPWWVSTNDTCEPLTLEKLEAAIEHARQGWEIGTKPVGPPTPTTGHNGDPTGNPTIHHFGSHGASCHRPTR